MAGQNMDNTRDAADERTISPANVARLHVKWSLTTNGSVFDTPAVSNGVVYITDHGSASLPSTLWAIRARTGQVIWSRSISSYTGIGGDISRATPTLTHGMLILGDTPEPFNGGPWLFAVNAATGNLVWKTHLDSHPTAIDTTSPVVYGSRVIVGVSSYEEGVAAEPGYPCCTFRGSLMTLDIWTGDILWKTYMTPSNGGQPGGYSGNAVWGSTPVVDPRKGMVYVATGNNYTVPAGVCTSPTETDCSSPASNDYSDSIVALSLVSGAVIWAHPTLTGDVFTTACTDPGEECGPDFDFGSGPNMYALDAATGAIRWQFASGGAVVAGAAIVDGTVYWGSGYYYYGAPNDKLYAFGL
jgi:polyvinyl alcohol dehydrogenase (cytochrome)